MSSFSFIVNPKAGNRRGEALLRKLPAELERRKMEARILTTEGPLHATQLAQSCPDGSTVVAVGGDGTINEVANGLAGSGKILGILPNGSGNDLIKSLGIPLDHYDALDLLQAGKTALIDCGRVVCRDGREPSGNSKGRFFVNGVGVGFDAAVAERTRQIKYLSGTSLYLMAVFQQLGKYVSPDFEIVLDGSVSRSRNLLIAIGNGRCAGGGFYLTPLAEPDDGYLDVCLISELSVPRILMIMPKVMHGAHIAHKAVTMKRAKQIHISAPQNFFVHADGEIVGREVHAVEIQIAQGALHAVVG